LIKFNGDSENKFDILKLKINIDLEKKFSWWLELKNGGKSVQKN